MQELAWGGTAERSCPPALNLAVSKGFPMLILRSKITKRALKLTGPVGTEAAEKHRRDW